jgi:hypothetical protein
MHMNSRRKDTLKLNVIGIVGGILAFVSLALPWWTMSVSAAYSGYNYSVDVSVYPYMASAAGFGTAATSLWYGWLALILIVVGGLLGIVGSLKPDKAKLLSYGGILALVSIILFAVGLQLDLLQGMLGTGAENIYLFDSRTVDSASYFAYLSFGFWIALVAAILMFAASRKKPAQIAGYPPPPPPPVVY